LILIVEDEPSIAEVVDLYLRRAGYQTLRAADGRAALEALDRSQPDLVILDIMLPQVDGFAITRWIRDRGDTPIIIVSSRREESDRIAGLELGADDYVVKPFSPRGACQPRRAVLRRCTGEGRDGPSPSAT
jgi:DNA-binding response OmpR family regulator